VLHACGISVHNEGVHGRKRLVASSCLVLAARVKQVAGCANCDRQTDRRTDRRTASLKARFSLCGAQA